MYWHNFYVAFRMPHLQKEVRIEIQAGRTRQVIFILFQIKSER